MTTHGNEERRGRGRGRSRSTYRKTRTITKTLDDDPDELRQALSQVHRKSFSHGSRSSGKTSESMEAHQLVPPKSCWSSQSHRLHKIQHVRQAFLHLFRNLLSCGGVSSSHIFCASELCLSVCLSLDLLNLGFACSKTG